MRLRLFQLPAGAGMSSSAAFELATAKALAALYADLMSRVCKNVVGRKTNLSGCHGILDQGVSAYGQVDHLVRIDCAIEVFSMTPMPAGAHFWIFNSNKKHALVDSA